MRLLWIDAGWGARHTLVVLGFLGYAVSYAMRFNLSLTIVAMVRHKPLVLVNDASSDTLGTNCAADVKYNANSSVPTVIIDKDGEFAGFDWYEAEEGLIFGDLCWGYFVI